MITRVIVGLSFLFASLFCSAELPLTYFHKHFKINVDFDLFFAEILPLKIAFAQATDKTSLPDDLISSYGRIAPGKMKFEKKIAFSLEKLGKNLILESTRGAKEVQVYQKAAPAVVLILTEDGVGSGCIIDDSGQVLTNWHVVGDHETVVAVFKPKDSAELKKELAFKARVEKIDKVADLALLKIINSPKDISKLTFGDSSGLQVGQDTHAIGHPQGEIWTYTKGFISQIRSNYEWATADGIKHQAKVIQTQTPINPGNSGGPLLDDQAHLIGLNSFLAEGQGLNYAVAVDDIRTFLNRKGDRLPAAEAPANLSRCSEAYDTPPNGWPKIVGCYGESIQPPPDFWIVYRRQGTPPAYMAADVGGNGGIDTVTVLSKDKQGKELLIWHFDEDCDGVVDLLGYQSPNKEDIQSFSKPSRDIHIRVIAKELDAAFKTGQIPYKKIAVCH